MTDYFEHPTSYYIYLLKQVFTYGQLYVSVSQVTKREGLTVLNADGDTEHQTSIKNIRRSLPKCMA